MSHSPLDPNIALCSDHGGEHPNIADLPELPLSLQKQYLELETRRHFLARGSKALAWAGLASIIGRTAPELFADPEAVFPKAPHFAPKAKRAIYLFMAGAPSQFETFDYKPNLVDQFNKDLPE